jgi:hypothetical protein
MCKKKRHVQQENMGAFMRTKPTLIFSCEQRTKAPSSHVQHFFFFYDLVPFFILSFFFFFLCSLSQEQVTLCILLVMGQIWLEERTAAEKSNQNANGGGNGRGRDRR